MLTWNPLGKNPGVVYLDHMVGLFQYFESFHADFHMARLVYIPTSICCFFLDE